MTTTTPRPTSYYLPGEHPKPENELARLARQATLSWAKEANLLREYGLAANHDVLEVGSGPGYISELMLREIPEGTLTCLELEEHLMDYARGYLADAGPRLTLVNGSVLESPLADESFDLAYARLVIQHVPGPDKALAEIHRMLRPGGRVVIADVNDEVWGWVSPDLGTPAFQEVLQARIDLQVERGGDRLIARRLPQLLREAGFQDVRVDAVMVSSDEFGMDDLRPQMDFRSRTAAMVAAKPESGPAVEATADAVDEWLKEPNASVNMLMYLISATKPEA
ncbi:methyltransferase domain-containing protein [Streptomyces kaniharaensis]|uniref:Methyltransferase domain-containing protein n=1 Tax=Streptomyces kaniharaensis TaxID=212423 RepID=A0A6N7KZC3_9ACTN|nr:methyltransferase domain-containing protein [Streptomyces kaniharaensis]MQS14933.1 methyltransferase domain-containing protein [Streptomyces kaniharaensis]